jgi:hypothetical protein
MINKKQEKKDFAAIANFRDKNEKASWLRKKKNLEALVVKLEPMEEELRRINATKMEIFDEIVDIRKTMIVDCIHPQDYLVHYQKYIKCRFCESNISIPRKI